MRKLTAAIPVVASIADLPPFITCAPSALAVLSKIPSKIPSWDYTEKSVFRAADNACGDEHKNPIFQ